MKAESGTSPRKVPARHAGGCGAQRGPCGVHRGHQRALLSSGPRPAHGRLPSQEGSPGQLRQRGSARLRARAVFSPDALRLPPSFLTCSPPVAQRGGNFPASPSLEERVDQGDGHTPAGPRTVSRHPPGPHRCGHPPANSAVCAGRRSAVKATGSDSASALLGSRGGPLPRAAPRVVQTVR